MLEKPSYLGLEYASAFGEQSVVAAYTHRPPYPDEVFDVLQSLMVDAPAHVLDVGCGRGDIARRLVERVDRIDAVDMSAAMIATGRRLPNGDHPQLRWIVGRAEDVPLDPPYALIVAGQSLHWMDWYTVLPRFAAMLTPRGFLAVVTEHSRDVPWRDELDRLIKHYSTNQHYQPFDMLVEFERYGLFEQHGVHMTAPVPLTQSIDEYIESFHGMSSLSRDRMGAAQASEFDAAVRAIVTPYAPDGTITRDVIGDVAWGKPKTLTADE